jgi:hypothetical protein
MLYFTVPCLFHGKHKSDFHIYIGQPAAGIDPSKFQAQWLTRFRHGIIDKAFRKWLVDVHTYAIANKLDFTVLCASGKLSATSQSEPSGQSVLTDLKVIDIAKAAMTVKSSRTAASKKPLTDIPPNLLIQLWTSDLTKETAAYHRTKEMIVNNIVSLLCQTSPKTSNACHLLLRFLLSCERVTLGHLLKTEMDVQQINNLTSLLSG